MNEKIKGLLIVLLAAASAGAAAPVAKYVYQYDITPSLMLVLRFFMASSFLWVYIFINRKRINYKLDKQQVLIMVAIGAVAYFLACTFYFNAIVFIPVSLHVTIFYTYPFMVNIFSFFVLKEKITGKQFFVMVIAFIGVLLTVSMKTMTLSSIGIIFSVLAAISNGSYVLLLGVKKIGKVDSVVTAAYATLFGSISFFVYCIARGEFHLNVPMNGLAGIAFIAIVSTAIAVIALSKGVRIIGASKASIISIFEPVEGIILSFIFLNESMGMKQLFGVVLIMSAIVFLNCSNTVPKEQNEVL